MSLSRRAILLIVVLQLLGLGMLGLSIWQREQALERQLASSRRVLGHTGMLHLQDSVADLFLTIDELRSHRSDEDLALALQQVDRILERLKALERSEDTADHRELLASLHGQYWGIRQALALLRQPDRNLEAALTNAAVTAVYANTYQLQDLGRHLRQTLAEEDRTRVLELRTRRQQDLLLMAGWLALGLLVLWVTWRQALRPWRVLEEIHPGRLDTAELDRLEHSRTPELAAIGHTLNRLVQGRNKLHLRHQEQLDELNRRLGESNRVRNDFLAGISHEIRTPMNNLVGNLELLEAGLGEHDDRRRIHSIQHAVDDLLAVINDLLAFSRLENEELQLTLTDFDLHQTVEGVCENHSHLAFEKGLEFSCILEPGLPGLLRGDAGRLRQVLNNLVGNAVKFTPEGLVEVRVSQLHGTEEHCTVCFEIRDTGIGIDPARLPHLFEPFVQAEGSLSRSHEGLGLGLSISRRLVELLGGRITVRSQPGRGSVFTFKIQFEVLRAHHGPEHPRTPVLLIGSEPGFCEALHSACADLGAPSTDLDQPEAALPLLASGEPAWQSALVLLSLRVVQEASPAVISGFLAALPGGCRLALVDSEGTELAAVLPLLPSAVAVLRRPLRRTALKALLDNDHRGTVEGLAWQDGPRPAGGITETAPDGAPAPDDREPGGGPAGRLAEGPTPWSGYRILAVDDNPVNLKLIQNQLEKRGYGLLCAEDGQGALDLLEHETVDLVLMDCMMPRLDGLSATRRLREREQGRWTRVIALTANAVGGDRERCIAAGMDDYLEKPVRRAALFAMLDRYLPPRELPPGAPPEVASAGGPGEAAPAVQAPPAPPVVEHAAAGVSAGGDGRSHLDLSVIQNDSEGDREFEQQLIRLFIKDARRRITSLEQAIGEGRAETVHLEAHTVKGICAGIGAMAMMQLAFELERRGSGGNLDGAGGLLEGAGFSGRPGVRCGGPASGTVVQPPHRTTGRGRAPHRKRRQSGGFPGERATDRSRPAVPIPPLDDPDTAGARA